MKKGLFALLMAVALVAPAFAAEKGEISIIPKIGIQPEVMFDLDYSNADTTQYDLNTMYVFDLEAFYSVSNIFSVGAGVSEGTSGVVLSVTEASASAPSFVKYICRVTPSEVIVVNNSPESVRITERTTLLYLLLSCNLPLEKEVLNSL